MASLYIPAWKTKDGDRLLLIAENWQLKSWDDANQKRAADFIFLVSFGLTTSGIVEVGVDENGHASDFPHVEGRHDMLGPLVWIGGPKFDEAMAREAAS